MSGGFQTKVNNQPAPAVEGDFASMNPRFTVDAGPGGLVAGANGAIVGRFCWATNPSDADGAPAQVGNSGSGPVTGFLAREQQGLITIYLADASMAVPEGFQLTLFNGGDFWVMNNGAGFAEIGMKAYANFADGKVSFAATGSPTAGATSTSSTIAPETFSVTGLINGSVLTVSAVGSGTVVPGATISGTGIASGTKIVSQLSGTSGGVGTYAVSIGSQNVASTTVSGTYGLLTVGGTVAGTFGVGDVISGSGVTAGTMITALGTGTGGAGTYVVDVSQTVGTGEAIDVDAVNVETKWYCMSPGAPGQLVKISDHPLG